ncbi:MAG: gamma-glutamyl-gamma-aminobutyrate hydrolase family protein [Patescibacteria group bacterium]|jgi:GMP synthase (glutamine-hydrolysing)
MFKKILIVDNNSKHTAKIAKLFSGDEISICKCEDFESDKAETFDLVVLSGGSHTYAADNEKNAYSAEIEFIKQTKKPLIGICLGCQLIAKAFGGKLTKLAEKQSGILEIAKSVKKYEVFESHKYAISEMPDELETLAESETGPEIIRHRARPTFGFQFHPEVFPRKTDGKKLFDQVIAQVIKSA